MSGKKSNESSCAGLQPACLRAEARGTNTLLHYSLGTCGRAHFELADHDRLYRTMPPLGL